MVAPGRAGYHHDQKRIFKQVSTRWVDQMKTQCLLRRNQYHTTAWMDAEATKLGLVVEIPQLGGLWEIVEIYPYRLTDKQLRTRKTLMLC